MASSREGNSETITMPVLQLQPSVSVSLGVGVVVEDGNGTTSLTRARSGRIRKPARNFNSDDYEIPTLVKKNIPSSGTSTSTTATATATVTTAKVRKRRDERAPPVLKNERSGGGGGGGGGGAKILKRGPYKKRKGRLQNMTTVDVVVVGNEKVSETGDQDQDQLISTTSSDKYDDDFQEELDLGLMEIEESSGTVVRPDDVSDPELKASVVTTISIKTALMCALKISEEFLPTSHAKYLDQLEVAEKYSHEDINDIRTLFDIKPSASNSPAAPEKHKLDVEPVNPNKKAKIDDLQTTNVEPSSEITDDNQPKCQQKVMEDEITVIEKLGNNKIMAAGKVIEIDYENYLKETDVKISLDPSLKQKMPKLLPPSVSNCHAPPCRLGCICYSISEDMPPRKHCGKSECFFDCSCPQFIFSKNGNGDIRSRLRPRQTLLNWKAESNESAPMTSYRQMERGANCFRVRRGRPPSSVRVRNDLQTEGNVVKRAAAKVIKKRFQTKTLQSAYQKFRAAHGTRKYVRIAPKKSAQQSTDVGTYDEIIEEIAPATVDLDLEDVDISPVNLESNPSAQPPSFMTKKNSSSPEMTAKDIKAIKNLIGRISEDCQLLAFDDRIAFFSWTKTGVNPKVVMYQYQAQLGDELQIPWIYLPIPPQGYSWICHYLSSSFENSDYVYIPEIKCSISTQALKVNMNSAFRQKKGVAFDVKASGNSPGIGKIYFFPDLPKALICGPFKTHETNYNPLDEGNFNNIQKALLQMEKLKCSKSYASKRPSSFVPVFPIFPFKKRNDNETTVSPAQSKQSVGQVVYPNMYRVVPVSTAVNANATSSFKPPPRILSKSSLVGFPNSARFIRLDGQNTTQQLPNFINLNTIGSTNVQQ